MNAFKRSFGETISPRKSFILYTRPPHHVQYYRTCVPRSADVFPSQVEDRWIPPLASSIENTSKTPQTLTEKIVQRHSVDLPSGKKVKSGDYVTLAPYHCMTHDNSWPVALKFMSMGASHVHSPAQVVMTLDHDVQNKSEQNLRKYRQIQEFAKQQNIDFFPAGRGIGHQIMVEEGYAFPGRLVVASDSHSNMYGGVGSLGTPVVRTDAASIMATGMTWWQIPPVARIHFTGTLPLGVTGKDVIVALCGLFNKDEVLNHAVEFTGSEEAMRCLSIDDRLTIANMTTEFGCLSGLFPIDKVLQAWFRYKATEAALYQAVDLSVSSTIKRLSHQRLDEFFDNPISADEGAQYAKQLHLNLSTLSPYVSGPNSVKIATPLEQLAQQNIKIDKAYLLSCTAARREAFAAAAKVFKDASESNNGQIPRIPSSVQFYIAAASLPEQLAAEEAGDWQILLEAGAIPLPAACGACIGMGTGLLEPDEVGISASNRNYQGRMGSREAKCYLASPEVVAASALRGAISGPGWYKQPEGWSGVVFGEGDGIQRRNPLTNVEVALEEFTSQLDGLIQNVEKEIGVDESKSPNEGSTKVAILDGFPAKVEGEILFCDADNINTDGIYPGKMTYQDDVTKEKMAEACMSNYDPEFSSIVRPGDILVSGFNFGTGSSREQAATAILAGGIPLVVAGSFGNIFSRNSINNALMGVESPELIHRLRQTFSNQNTPSATTKPAVQEPTTNKDSLDSPPPAPPTRPEREKLLTRRTGWKFTWDVAHSEIHVQEGPGGRSWSQKVGDLPPNVQEIIASGGLEKWVQRRISKSKSDSKPSTSF